MVASHILVRCTGERVWRGSSVRVLCCDEVSKSIANVRGHPISASALACVGRGTPSEFWLFKPHYRESVVRIGFVRKTFARDFLFGYPERSLPRPTAGIKLEI